ncbi:PQ-loop repeat-containing protein [Ureaplasma canigenitalium]|uniref:hypothetical protein n=1 Tax=Ureaplasma canigenitalium TaxID=42092 RepID=UPI00068BA91C|nr:hypothetical protein [Ureaplasma canigenitalium]
MSIQSLLHAAGKVGNVYVSNEVQVGVFDKVQGLFPSGSTAEADFINPTRYGYPTDIWGVVFQVMGAVLVFAAFVPVVIQVLRTKRTETMSLLMWIINVLALGLLSIFAWMGVSVTVGGFILVAMSETLSFLASLIVIAVKAYNMNQAKAKGMSELEYCEMRYPMK